VRRETENNNSKTVGAKLKEKCPRGKPCSRLRQIREDVTQNKGEHGTKLTRSLGKREMENVYILPQRYIQHKVF
jgi:hypothetical protein